MDGWMDGWFYLTVSLGKKLFPRCTRVLNSFMDDDLSDQGAFKVGSPEEHAGKKQRYSELKSVVAEAFQKDVAAMERHPADSCKG
ncbi:hypothetical protein KP509_05G055000 [Ceratopteris richardii]|uniref:NPR1/NIM1-like C-terminal domain-containing protein n=1 Tax=Ceratopteris richardii TaxID=49495 RepID=A0A8T2UNU4_CERRI|nr:hypothetical protein KP509_05G055000 [Ceratopteris richardii]